MSEIDHPNVIKLHSSFQDRTKLYFLLELANNGELHTYMHNEGRINFIEAQFLTAQIVNVLEFLREQDICHRDLKPSNLLFDHRMHLKLADFGAAKKIESEGDSSDTRNYERSQSGESNDVQNEFFRKSTFVGTCEYMAPEVISGKTALNA